ncbi:hypothetical protein SAMN05216419_100714 [Nitrosomonas cryotolerans]|nr:hypothetical protein SAMN05216419_100714 [Nitrosomonas cryotolerans]
MTKILEQQIHKVIIKIVSLNEHHIISCNKFRQSSRYRNELLHQDKSVRTSRFALIDKSARLDADIQLYLNLLVYEQFFIAPYLLKHR